MGSSKILALATVTIRPEYWRDWTHMPGLAPWALGGSPISMLTVWMTLRLMTSPRTRPMVMRSPTLKVLPRRMTK